jgi:hypothetical protein
MKWNNGLPIYSDAKYMFDHQQMVRTALHRLRSRGEEINDLDVMFTNGQFMFSTEGNVGELVKAELQVMFQEERDKKIDEILKQTHK